MTITIKNNFVSEEEIKKSRFICSLKRVETEEEARDFIAQIKKEHRQANHNCMAYTIGDHQEIQRTSDDGEPSGTAGIPMLEILKKREITNVCAVVTRYFGGIKLGAGGLIRAYGGVVNHAIDEVGCVQFVEQEEICLTLDYNLFDSCQRLIFANDLSIEKTNFKVNVEVSFFIDLDAKQEFLLKLTDQFHGKIKIDFGDKQMKEVALKL